MNKKPMRFGVILALVALIASSGVAREDPVVFDQGGTVYVSFLTADADPLDGILTGIGWIGWSGAQILSVGAGAEAGTALQGELGGGMTSVLFGSLAEIPAPDEPIALDPQPASIVALARIPENGLETYVPIAFEAKTAMPADSSWLYEWDFNGDGVVDASGSSAIVRHSYDQDGVFPVQVEIRDAFGGRLLSEPLEIVIVNRAPEAGFQTLDDGLTEQEAVEFADVSTDLDGRIVAWQWDFGDGAGSSEQAPTHVYAAQGEYRVTLLVTDDDGDVSEPYEQVILIENAPPVAAFRVEISDAEPGTVFFEDASSDPSPAGEIVHVAWDFGDGTYQAGSPSEGRTYRHQFEAPGAYTVTLFVIDRDGTLSTQSEEILIQALE